MQENKGLKPLYEAAVIDVISFDNNDVIRTSNVGGWGESSGGNLDPNWDVN